MTIINGIVNKLINWEQPIRDAEGRLRFQTYDPDLTDVSHCGHRIPLDIDCPECQILSKEIMSKWKTQAKL